MKNLSWAAYGLGVAVVVFVLMGGWFGIVEKSLLVAATLFIGAIIAAINELTRAVSRSRRSNSSEAPVRERSKV